ncbi:conserved hypothetical protein [Talaromyces stipitatus ATCC 10500]|uniref:Uncharacterized protein n=1 Tax=Talaromyces stipitatus (strain ATCC 10500 / CBS 375.48 / QM 6759 / NRRL 1006) TaxID=441959 RepID=B8ME61_TALSN|nr:uncharacterized protein TSTA_015730 [Talaromyces stipitatus ATCC 10500]EED16488.1 conserved hypothetical protein [Talaromyces stipitatus ATCC 10500]
MSLSRSYRTATKQVRSFSVSTRLRIGPESPNYIEVPQTLQPDLPAKPRVKGTLPVPREIFPARRPDKPTPAYISAVTPEPSKVKTIKKNDPNAETIAWKQRMADSRRTNLREGLLELYERKENTVAAMTRRSAAKQARRERVLRQPQREDERLTSPSVVQSLEEQPSSLPDPDREIRIAQSRERVLQKQLQKSAERHTNLHTLYMNAREFIVTEEQLMKEIEDKFREDGGDEWRSDSGVGTNVWAKGAPPTIQSIVNNQTKDDVGRWRIEQERMSKVVEEMTGGKITIKICIILENAQAKAENGIGKY